MKQIIFATLAEAGKKLKTKRERFLGKMEAVVSWSALEGLIDSCYPKAGESYQSHGLEKLRCIYFLQHWLNFSYPGMENALHDVLCMRAFDRSDLFDESMPGETTILKFRQLLEKHQLTAANVSDGTQLPNLRCEDDQAVCRKKVDVAKGLKGAARKAGGFWGAGLISNTSHKLTEWPQWFSRNISSPHGCVKHLFRGFERKFGYMNVRHKGLAKHAAQVFTVINLNEHCLTRRAMLT